MMKEKHALDDIDVHAKRLSLQIRMPARLHERIKDDAELSNRSLNGHICALLEKALQPIGLRTFSDGELLGEVRRRFPNTTISVNVILNEEQLRILKQDSEEKASRYEVGPEGD